MSNQATILFVDDEERVLRSLKFLFKSNYTVHTATTGNEALEIVLNNTIHVIISDQRMPEMFGVDLLHKVKEISPNTTRLLLTGYSELGAIVSSVNEGEIYRYINKPWDNDEIKKIVHQAAMIGMDMLNMPPPQTNTEQEGFGILVIDDDINTYNTVMDIAEETDIVQKGTNLDSAMTMIANDKNIAVVISELTIDGEDMSLALKMMKLHYPHILVLVLSNIEDAQTLIELVNQGRIFRFLLKPVRKPLLETSLKAAKRHYLATQQQPALLVRERISKTIETSNPSLFNRIKKLFS